MYRCMAYGRHPWCLHSLITCTRNLKWMAVKRESRKFFLSWRTLYFLLICIYYYYYYYYYYYHRYHHSFLWRKKGRVMHKVSTVDYLNILLQRAKELAKCVRDNKVLLYQGSFKWFKRFKGLFIVWGCILFLTGINFLRSQYFSRLLGLCNNFGYVVMLSAAHDILAVNGTDQVLRNNLLKVLWPLL